jgi:xanthine dehydrogenase YagS FAD-binding subunit
MKSFMHVNATSVDEAASTLADFDGKAKIVAGGTDIIDILKDEALPDYPEALVNIKAIPGLDSISENGGMLTIGALTKLSTIVSDGTISAKYPILAEAADSVASPQIRNMGTLGGNICQDTRCWYYRAPQNYFYCFRKGGSLCHAVPGDNRYSAILGGAVCFTVCPSDMAIALSALDANLVTNKRNIPISSLYKVLTLDLDTDEIVTEVQIPTPQNGAKQTFNKFRTRKAVDFAITSVATVVNIEGGVVSDSRIILGAVAPVPYRATDAENAIKGKAINETTAQEAADAAVNGALALSKNAFKITLVKTMVKDALMS